MLAIALYEVPVSFPAGQVAAAKTLIEQSDVDGALSLSRVNLSFSHVLKNFLDLQVEFMQRSVVDGISSFALVPEIALVPRSALGYANTLSS